MKQMSIGRHCLSATLFFVLSQAAILSAQTVDIDRVVERFEPEIQRAMQEGHIPSCSVALVADDRVVWKSAYGHSNLWAKTPARTDTVYLIGSTFKTISGAALLQQMEHGSFDLDDPVRDYLKFPIQGELSDKPVTFRHLFSHTSGLPTAFGAHSVWGDSVPSPIDVYLKAKLHVTNPPEKQVVYSNMAYTLIAHLVEQFAKQPYRTYVNEQIFDKLGMKSTAFEPTPAMQERLAVPYVANGKTGDQRPTVRLKADVWPAGIVYGTVEDQAKWLITVLSRGEFKGTRILQAETVEKSFQVQYPRFAGNMPKGWGNETAGFGLTWWSCLKGGQRHIAHSGSVPGYTAFLEGNADHRLGFAILTNGNGSHPHLIRLADLAIELMKDHSKN